MIALCSSCDHHLSFSPATQWSGMTNPFRIIDGSLPVSSLLYEDEEFVSSQDGVGLYDGYVL